MSRSSHGRATVAGAFGKNKFLENISESDISMAEVDVAKKKELHLNAGLELDLYRELTKVQDEVLTLMQEATEARDAKQTIEAVHSRAKDMLEDAWEDHRENPSYATSQTVEGREKKFSDLARDLAAATSAHKTITQGIIDKQSTLTRFGCAVLKQDVQTHKQRKEHTKRVCKAISAGFGSNESSRLQEALSLPSERVMALIQSRSVKSAPQAAAGRAEVAEKMMDAVQA